MKNNLKEMTTKAGAAVLSATTQASSAAKSTTIIAGKTAVKVGQSASNAAKKTSLLVGDLNGDGKIDQEDAKIALAMSKKAVTIAASEIVDLSRQALKSDLVKAAAAGAIVGAAIAVPIPLIGPAAGAAVGGTVGAYKHLVKN